MSDDAFQAQLVAMRAAEDDTVERLEDTRKCGVAFVSDPVGRDDNEAGLVRPQLGMARGEDVKWAARAQVLWVEYGAFCDTDRWCST